MDLEGFVPWGVDPFSDDRRRRRRRSGRASGGDSSSLSSSEARSWETFDGDSSDYSDVDNLQSEPDDVGPLPARLPVPAFVARGGGDDKAPTKEDNDDEPWTGPRLQSQFRRFAEWVFGPRGVSSLEVLLCGDFSRRGPTSRFNVVLCRRDAQNRRRYRHVQKGELEWQGIFEEYGDSIMACPVGQLMHNDEV